MGAKITPVDAPPVVLLAPDRTAYARLARLITRGRVTSRKGDCALRLADLEEFCSGVGLIAIALPPLGPLPTSQTHEGRESKPPRSVSAISGRLNLYIPMDGAVDLEKEKARLAKELEKARRDAEVCAGRLSDPKFAANAPAAEVAKIRTRAEEAGGVIGRLTAILEELK